MKLTGDQVKKVAKLANLPLSQEEEEKYSEQLSKILEYVKQLNSVNTDGVEPTFNVSGLNSVMRNDKSEKSLTQDEALQNASKKENTRLPDGQGFFVTKGVFKDE